ncbi:unnamed protein product [Caretta caretta]
MSLTFEDVAMYFSPVEWALLGEEQRQLYKHVMWENYQTLVSLGIQTPKPVVISSIERGEELCVQGPTEDEDEDVLSGTRPAGARNLSRAAGQTPEEWCGNLEPLRPFPGTSGKKHSKKSERGRHHKRQCRPQRQRKNLIRNEPATSVGHQRRSRPYIKPPAEVKAEPRKSLFTCRVCREEFKMSVTFEDVAMYFSSAEWVLLGEEQRQLYKHVMWENYQTLVSLGIQTPKPVVISSIERGEELCVQGPTEDEDGVILRGTRPDFPAAEETWDWSLIESCLGFFLTQTSSPGAAERNPSCATSVGNNSAYENISLDIRGSTLGSSPIAVLSVGKNSVSFKVSGDTKESIVRGDPIGAMSVGEYSVIQKVSLCTRESTPGKDSITVVNAGKSLSV